MSAAVHQIAPHIPRSPQLEDGFTRIANELLDALAGADLTEREARVMYRIIRLTYGFGKKIDDITASQIGFICRMATTHVSATLKTLSEKKCIIKRTGSYGSVIGIQKDHSLWPMRPIPAEYSDPKFGKKKHGRPSKDFTPEEPEAIPDHAYEEKTPTDSVVVFPDFTENPYQFGQKPLPIPSKTPTDSVDTKESIPKKEEPKKKPLSVPRWEPDAFERFWETYPNKEGRKPACKHWDALKPDADLVEAIIASIAKHKKSRKWRDGFAPQGDTFLSKALWEDVIPDAYSEDELTVLRNYNDMIGGRISKFIEDDTYSEERAQLARRCLQDLEEIVGHPERGEYSARYFAFILQNCPPHLLVHMTPERVMRSVAKIVNKDFSK